MLFYALSIYVYSFFYGYQPGSPFILFQRRRREPNEKLKRAEEKSRNKRASAEGARGAQGDEKGGKEKGDERGWRVVTAAAVRGKKRERGRKGRGRKRERGSLSEVEGRVYKPVEMH